MNKAQGHYAQHITMNLKLLSKWALEQLESKAHKYLYATAMMTATAIRRHRNNLWDQLSLDQ